MATSLRMRLRSVYQAGAGLAGRWENDRGVHITILLIVGLYLFLLGNGAIFITDNVESNYALTAKEMVLSGNYLSPQIYGAFWYDKPVFFYWQLAGAFSLFGFTEFAARLWPAFMGAAGLLLTYFFIARLYTPPVGLFSALILAVSLEYWIIAKMVITDMTLFFFFNGALVFFYLAYRSEQKNYYYLCYLCAALATLTKGPIGFLLPGLIVTLFFCWTRNFAELKRMRILTGLALFLLVAAPWYVLMYWEHGDAFVESFFGVHNFLRATVSEHPQYDVFYYYIVIFGIGFFPWTCVLPFVIRHFWREWKRRPALSPQSVYLGLWTACVVGFFQLAATKYPTYTFPYFLPLTAPLGVYFVRHKRAFTACVAGSLALYTVLTFSVAVPFSHIRSSKNIALLLKQACRPQTIAVSYGDYPTGADFYSGALLYDLKKKEDIARSRPHGLSWKSKNVTPMLAAEDLPPAREVLAVVEKDKLPSFRQEAPGKWQVVGDSKKRFLLRRDAAAR